jgi:serine/threonine-protein kinase
MQETQRQPDAPAPLCPACGAPLRSPAMFCPSCGAPLLGATGRLASDRTLAGRYRILRLLARGGMGAVYLAEDMRLDGAQVAVKEMASSFVRGDTEAFARAVAEFKREAALLARLRHPNLPRVSDRFEEDGKHFLVMEYIHGQTLRDLLAQAGGRLPLAQALGYAGQISEVLAYLHSQQPPSIYRDLKPANVMIEGLGSGDRGLEPDSPNPQPPIPGPRLVLIDFGIARFYRPGSSSDTAVYGTLGYAPPEQYGRGQTDARTDVYALGVLLHHMLTGHDPSATPFALPAPRALDRSIPPHVASAIERATQSDPAQRFPDILALRAALHAHDAATTPAVVQPTILQPPAPQPRERRRFAVWLLGLLALAAIAALLLVLLPGMLANNSIATTGGPTAAPAASAPTFSPRPATPTPLPTAAPTPSGQAPALANLAPSQVSASGVYTPSIDAQQNPVSYEPDKATDGAPDTTWRVSGDGVGQWIQLDFASEVGVQKVGIIPGYDKVDPFDGTDRFTQNRVVKRARLEFSNGIAFEATFEPRRDMQFVQLPQPIRTRWLRVVVLETYPPAAAQDARDSTAISEIVVQGTK